MVAVGRHRTLRGPLHWPPHPSAGTQRPPTDRASPTCSSETFVAPLLPSSEPPSLALHQEPSGHHSGQPSLPRDPSRNHCVGAVLAVWDSACEWGGGCTGLEIGPAPARRRWGELGGRGPRPAQPPSAPTLAPAAARIAQLTSFANCSSLRAPAARPGWPPTSGRAREWGGGGGGGDSSRLPLSAGGGGRPSPPPARIIIPVTCLPRHPKAGPRFWNTWRGRGGPPRRGWEERGRRASAPALPPTPRKSFSYLGGSSSAPASGAPAPARGQDSASSRCLLN